MTQKQITEIKLEIDRIKEYVESELCQKCEQMSKRLIECEELVKNYILEHNQEA